MDRLELSTRYDWWTKLGQEFCGQSNNRGPEQRRLLQAADFLQHGSLQVFQTAT